MGKSKSALPDLAMAIQLKPDFLAVSSPDHLNFVSMFLAPLKRTSCTVYAIIPYPYFKARLQRGNILLKQGSTQDARQDFEAVVRLAPNCNFLSFHTCSLFLVCTDWHIFKSI